MERRSSPRSFVSDAPQLRSELLIIDSDEQRSPISGNLWDVSETGASFVCPRSASLLDLPPGQAMELVVRYEELTLRLDAELRHARAESEQAVVLGMRLRRTARSAESLDQWPGLLWELRFRGRLRDLRDSVPTHRPAA